jgi:hypothetical protein
MTEAQLTTIVGAAIQDIMPTIGFAGNVPYVTGRLHSSIKLEPIPNGYNIIIDTGGLTLEE